MGAEKRQIMRRLLFAGSILLAQLTCTFAQTLTEQGALARARKFSGQVVRVVPKRLDGGAQETGFGIIVGEDDGKLYIATPRHILFGSKSASSPTPSIVFYSKPLEAVEGKLLVAIPAPNDLAVVTVPVPNGSALPHAPMVSTVQLPLGAWVWNIGVGTTWETPDRAGGYGGLDAPTNLIRVGELRTPPGASGGAGVTQDGLIGMVLQDSSSYSLLLPVESIVRLFQSYRFPVNLLYPVSLQAPKSAVQVKGTAASFCDDMRALLTLAGEKFGSIRKEPGSDIGWSTDARLYGFKICNVQKTLDISFGCQGDQVRDKNLGSSQVSALASKVRKCLGPQWSSNRFADNFGFSNLGSNDNVIVSLFPMLTVDGSQSFYSNINFFHHEAREVASIQSPTKPEGYCDALRLLIKAGGTQFSDILGRKQGEHGGWRSKVDITNWDNCWIHKFDNGNAAGNSSKERRYITCGVGPFGGKSAVEDMARQIGNDIKGSCLPNTWRLRTRSGLNDQLHIDFESSDTESTVEVRTSRNGDGSWDLKLDVDGPE